MTKLKEFQWACKFENKENDSSLEGQSWAFLLSNEYHYSVAKATHFHFVQVSSFVPLAKSRSRKKSFSVLFISHKHGHGNPPC